MSKNQLLTEKEGTLLRTISYILIGQDIAHEFAKVS